jgi:hypothetical protein
MKNSVNFLIIGIIAVGAFNLYGWFKHDDTCIIFYNQCPEAMTIQQAGLSIGQLIPEAAVSFLESTRDFNNFLKEVEKSELYRPKFWVLRAVIMKTIMGMENVRCKYEDILDISEKLEINIVILEKLIQFDYNGLQSKYNLNPSIFDKAAAFCREGDIKGIYQTTFDVTNAILEKLYKIKAKLEQELMPDLNLIWETSQLYFESEAFGQYVSRIFYEIRAEVNRN